MGCQRRLFLPFSLNGYLPKYIRYQILRKDILKFHLDPELLDLGCNFYISKIHYKFLIIRKA